VRRMRKDVTDECRNRADCRLPAGAVRRPVHLQQESNGNGSTDDAANRGKLRVLEAERSEKVAARHHEKAGEPAPANFSAAGRARPPARKSHESKMPDLKPRIDPPFPLLPPQPVRYIRCRQRDDKFPGSGPSIPRVNGRRHFDHSSGFRPSSGTAILKANVSVQSRQGQSGWARIDEVTGG